MARTTAQPLQSVSPPFLPLSPILPGTSGAPGQRSACGIIRAPCPPVRPEHEGQRRPRTRIDHIEGDSATFNTGLSVDRILPANVDGYVQDAIVFVNSDLNVGRRRTSAC